MLSYLSEFFGFRGVRIGLCGQKKEMGYAKEVVWGNPIALTPLFTPSRPTPTPYTTRSSGLEQSGRFVPSYLALL